MISLIFYRYTFFRFSPADLTPPYWINMGAMAISTLAGSLLIANRRTHRCCASLLPFLKGFTIFFWATGNWWIPMLRDPRCLAPRVQALSADVQPALLGRGLSARHVHRGDDADGGRLTFRSLPPCRQ